MLGCSRAGERSKTGVGGGGPYHDPKRARSSVAKSYIRLSLGKEKKRGGTLYITCNTHPTWEMMRLKLKLKAAAQ
jgi:hypothetical protein